MLQPSFKSVIEDSFRNKYYLYYSGTSVCCKEVSRDGIARDTIIVSQVSDNFLATIDLQDRIYVACQSKEKGIYIFIYTNGSWKLDQILNVQGNGNITLLSIFGINGALHIIYAKQMTFANFYNIYHLFKPISPDSYYVNTTWKKYNVCEMYAENPAASYAAIISKEGIIHIVCEWFDGSNFLINYCFIDNSDVTWKKKTVTTLFKKDIILNLLYEEGIIHLLCSTYEDDASTIFYYVKKDSSGKDFEFFCLDKINTDTIISPCFHMEGSVIYASWISSNKFYQYSLNKDQKIWAKKISGNIFGNNSIQLIEYIRNRKGRNWVVKNTYFTIDYKYNINLPYFKDNITDEANSSDTDSEKMSVRNVDGDLVRYIPYLIEEINTLSQMIKALSERLDKLETKKQISYENKPAVHLTRTDNEEPPRVNKEIIKLKRSNFKDQFLKSNTLLSRPEAAAVFMGSGNIPNPDDITEKEGIKFVENTAHKPKEVQPITATQDVSSEASNPRADNDAAFSKDGNIFKKFGDFFK